jgi:hypothetical protein
MKKLFSIYNGDIFIGSLALETPAPGEVLAKKIQEHLNKYYNRSEWTHVKIEEGILVETPEEFGKITD